MDYACAMDFVKVPLGEVRTATYGDYTIEVKRSDGDYLMSVRNSENEIFQWMVNTNTEGFEIFRVFGREKYIVEDYFSRWCDRYNEPLGTYDFKSESKMDLIMAEIIDLLKIANEMRPS